MLRRFARRDRARGGLRFAPVLVVLALVAAAQNDVLLTAVGALGPLGGWRCAQAAQYVYDPRRERADAALVVEAPERLVPADVQVVRVEVGLRGADTTVWTRPPGAAEAALPNRVFVLSAGALRPVNLGPHTICNAHLGSWKIIGEQDLG